MQHACWNKSSLLFVVLIVELGRGETPKKVIVRLQISQLHAPLILELIFDIESI